MTPTLTTAITAEELAEIEKRAEAASEDVPYDVSGRLELERDLSFASDCKETVPRLIAALRSARAEITALEREVVEKAMERARTIQLRDGANTPGNYPAWAMLADECDEADDDLAVACAALSKARGAK